MNIGELAKFRGGIATDTISEVTSASGVTIDSVLCKDGNVTGAASGTFTTTYVKAADTQGLALVNSSGTSVVTVSDAGLTTLVRSGDTKQLKLERTGTAAGYGFVGASSGSALTNYNQSEAIVFDVSQAGEVTVGPASGGSFHTMRTGVAAGSEILVLNKTATSAGTTSSYFIGFAQAGVADGYIWHDAGGSLAFQNASDVNLKENIRELSSGIATIKALRPVVFDWKTKEAKDCLGFIAQEVEQVLPRCVSEKNGIKLLSITNELPPILVKAIQELSAKVDTLQAELAALKGQ